jgi:hypothetical protein
MSEKGVLVWESNSQGGMDMNWSKEVSLNIPE